MDAFLSTELPLISPEFVLVTGDLTDAKSKWKLSSRQFEEEWLAYHDSLQKFGLLERRNGSFWHDLRGNHDCFDVASFHHPSNFYEKYSSSKKEGYTFEVKKSFGTYSFIALDAWYCLPVILIARSSIS